MAAEKQKMDAAYADYLRKKAQDKDNRYAEQYKAFEAAHTQVSRLTNEVTITQAKMFEEDLARTATSIDAAIGTTKGQVEAGLLKPLRDALASLNNLIASPLSISSVDPITPIVESVNLATSGRVAAYDTFLTTMIHGEALIKDAAIKLTLPEQGAFWTMVSYVNWAISINERTADLRREPSNKKYLLALWDAIRTRPAPTAIPPLTPAAAPAVRERRVLSSADIKNRCIEVKARADQFRVEANQPLAANRRSMEFERLLKGKSRDEVEKIKKEIRNELSTRYGRSPWIMAKIDKLVADQIALAASTPPVVPVKAKPSSGGVPATPLQKKPSVPMVPMKK